MNGDANLDDIATALHEVVEAITALRGDVDDLNRDVCMKLDSLGGTVMLTT
ncbi:MAG: hypothetical protein ACXWDM_14610 [Nocardioides sp.]